MPRPRLPPTPSGSTDLKALDKTPQTSADMESMFSLPPPALRASESQSQNIPTKSNPRENSSTGYTQSTPPISPKDRPLASSPRHKRTASGVVKSNNAETAPTGPSNSSSSYSLPPPPSRARKIIQMKPKSTPTNHSSPASDSSYNPPPSAAVSATNSGTKGGASSTTPKRKQPSATSAAGRKIARKTAHSIIERRRRSKMNEEFGVLKDMIPACEGVEMHKLAILQAGIEYVRYLEGCVSQLKAENDKKGKSETPASFADSRMQIDRVAEDDEDLDEDPEEEEAEDDDDDDDDDDEDGEDAGQDLPQELQPPAKVVRNNRRDMPAAANEWSFRDSRKSSVASLASSTYPSPHLLSQTQSLTDDQNGAASRRRPVVSTGTAGSYSASPSQIPTQSNIPSATPTPTLLSPAFNSIHFSPDLSRSLTNSSMGKSAPGGSGSIGLNTNAPSTSGSWTTVNNPSTSNPSPNMQPLPSPKAAMNLPLPHTAPAHLPQQQQQSAAAGGSGPSSSSSFLQLPQPFFAAASQLLGERDTHSKSPGALSDGSGTAEATASAALMMLTNDWRSIGADDAGRAEQANHNAAEKTGSGRLADGGDRGKGMSVRDLLSS